MAGYTKLFSDIVHSTVWREDVYTKIVWITMLAMSDKHGLVMASIPGLADMAKVNLQQCVEAINILSSPDPYSRTKDYEGRRISETDGGWLLLNHEKFRLRKDDEEQRLATADRVRRHRLREAEKAKNVTPCNGSNAAVTHGNAPLPHTDTDASTDADSKADAEPEAKPDIKSKEKSKEKDLSPDESGAGPNLVNEIFDYWKTVLAHPRAILDDKRKKLIKGCLTTGYQPEDLKAAILGCSLTPHNIGQNDQGQRFDSIELILRNAAQIDRFIQNSITPPKIDPITKHMTSDQRRMASTDKAIEEWLNESSIIEGVRNA